MDILKISYMTHLVGMSTGTTIKFAPVTAMDTMIRNGDQKNISTKHMCITAMKPYENKSLEELRLEDYLANRKGPQSSMGSLFSSPTVGSSTTGGGGLFGIQTKSVVKKT